MNFLFKYLIRLLYREALLQQNAMLSIIISWCVKIKCKEKTIMYREKVQVEIDRKRQEYLYHLIIISNIVSSKLPNKNVKEISCRHQGTGVQQNHFKQTHIRKRLIDNSTRMLRQKYCNILSIKVIIHYLSIKQHL